MIKNKEIVLITHWFGHIPFFMDCVVPLFLKRGYIVYHLTDKPRDAALFFQKNLGKNDDNLHHLPIEQIPVVREKYSDDRLDEVVRHWRGVEVALKSLFKDLGRRVGVFHTWVDLYSHPLLSRKIIERAMPCPWVGLYVHPAELRIGKSWKRKALENVREFLINGRLRPSTIKAFNSRYARKIYFYDENLIGQLRKKFRKTIELGVFPDCVKEDMPSGMINYPGFQDFRIKYPKVLCLAGFLSKRKGLLTLLRLASDYNGPWAFLFAGEVDWADFSDTEVREIKQFQENPPENTFFIRSLDDREFKGVILSSDLVYLAYENFFHSSNVQVIASLLKKPLIAGPKHLISERTKDYHLGWCLPELTPEAVKKLLEGINLETLEEFKTKARYEEFSSRHSRQALLREILEIETILSLEKSSP